MIQILILLSLLIVIFVPEIYIQPLLRSYRKRIGTQNEKSNLFFLPVHLGRVERFFTWLVFYIFPSNFITFLGIWFALKVVGNYKNWGNDHDGRGRFLAFIIGTSISIISVILIVLLTQWLISDLFPEPRPNRFSTF